MKIWMKAVYRLDAEGNYALVREESVCHDYDGPLALCGGGNSGDQQEESAQQQESQQQEQYESQLMGLFTNQFSQQSGVLQYLQGQMQSNISNPQGYTPQQLASMRTSSDDTLSDQYQSAQQALNAEEGQQNSANIPSGVNDQLDASLLNSEAQAKSSAQNQITQANANLEQQNYWNSVNALNGVASEYNPDALASAANSAGETETGDANSVANLSNANTNASNTGLLGVLGGVTSGIFGAAGKAGGFGSLFG